jgi:chromate transporter
VADALVSRQETAGLSISVWTIFLGFCEIGLSGFGGVLPWARRVIVERRRWLTEREFAELLGMCQILPGGNVINLAVCVGARYQGPLGSAAAVSGLMLAPFLIVSLIYLVYSQGGNLAPVSAALRGAAVVAVGLLFSTGVRLTLPYRRQAWALIFVAASFVAVGLFHWPLIPVVAALAPVSILYARYLAR